MCVNMTSTCVWVCLTHVCEHNDVFIRVIWHIHILIDVCDYCLRDTNKCGVPHINALKWGIPHIYLCDDDLCDTDQGGVPRMNEWMKHVWMNEWNTSHTITCTHMNEAYLHTWRRSHTWVSENDTYMWRAYLLRRYYSRLLKIKGLFCKRAL